MRAVVQRVSSARVTCRESDTVLGEIATGLTILLGVEAADTDDDVDWLLGKIRRLRIFEDDDGRMNRDVVDVDGRLLVVSQFTLHANCKKGNRPSFTRAAAPDHARSLIDRFIVCAEAVMTGRVEQGRFAASMQVSLVNEGPVTLILDSQQRDI